MGPVYGVDSEPEGKLAACYRNALRLADERGLESVAFPAISTGAFGYPMEEAAEVAFRAILDTIPELNSVKRIRMVLYRKRDLEIHEKVLRRMLEERGLADGR